MENKQRKAAPDRKYARNPQRKPEEKKKSVERKPPAAEKKQPIPEKKQEPRRSAPRRRSGLRFRILTVAAVVAAVVCCVTLFFQVRTINVAGNHLYTSEQIIEASGISISDNLVSIKKANAASRIQSTLPFVERVHIERTLPDTVTITVTESEVTFAIRAKSEQYYLLSAKGKLLQEIPTANAGDYPNVEGIGFSEPVVGAELVPDEESAENAAAAIRLMQLFTDYGIAGAVSLIDVSKPYDIPLQYGTQFEVLMGGSDNLDYKTEYLVAVLEKLGEKEAGVIDLTFEEEKTARFQPY